MYTYIQRFFDDNYSWNMQNRARWTNLDAVAKGGLFIYFIPSRSPCHINLIIIRTLHTNGERAYDAKTKRKRRNKYFPVRCLRTRSNMAVLTVQQTKLVTAVYAWLIWWLQWLNTNENHKIGNTLQTLFYFLCFKIVFIKRRADVVGVYSDANCYMIVSSSLCTFYLSPCSWNLIYVRCDSSQPVTPPYLDESLFHTGLQRAFCLLFPPRPLPFVQLLDTLCVGWHNTSYRINISCIVINFLWNSDLLIRSSFSFNSLNVLFISLKGSFLTSWRLISSGCWQLGRISIINYLS